MSCCIIAVYSAVQLQSLNHWSTNTHHIVKLVLTKVRLYPQALKRVRHWPVSAFTCRNNPQEVFSTHFKKILERGSRSLSAFPLTTSLALQMSVDSAFSMCFKWILDRLNFEKWTWRELTAYHVRWFLCYWQWKIHLHLQLQQLFALYSMSNNSTPSNSQIEHF